MKGYDLSMFIHVAAESILIPATGAGTSFTQTNILISHVPNLSDSNSDNWGMSYLSHAHSKGE